jgi:hypothetical protein
VWCGEVEAKSAIGRCFVVKARVMTKYVGTATLARPESGDGRRNYWMGSPAEDHRDPQPLESASSEDVVPGPDTFVVVVDDGVPPSHEFATSTCYPSNEHKLLGP